nr:hypothetical protein [Candidatus Sigynarchaeota archaeon]
MDNNTSGYSGPRGFAGVIAQQIEPLNSSLAFKKAYENAKPVRILLNATNTDHAALLIVENGKVQVKGIENKPASNLSRKSAGWDGFISCSTRTFLEIALGRLSMLKMLLKLLNGDIKVHAILKVLQFKKIMEYLGK